MPKILLVDDEANIRLLLQQSLEELEDCGVEIQTAENGSRALEIIAAERPELVFLDVMMPGLNGFEVCRRIRKNATAADLPVVFLTARGQDLDRREAMEAGATDFLTKPFDPEEVQAVARKILSLH